MTIKKKEKRRSKILNLNKFIQLPKQNACDYLLHKSYNRSHLACIVKQSFNSTPLNLIILLRAIGLHYLRRTHKKKREKKKKRRRTINKENDIPKEYVMIFPYFMVPIQLIFNLFCFVNWV